ncbi:hypothetical protein VN97_g5387 [Penicillium thymicola]|uniref:Uncharacterized protein n=1 Tax=Penicillium thymicola TaxID=293382 RepID=A0AAI9TIM9_PENTH|nr:hypothetical protein VN97_g5387 [Penicillium thymicola]
MEIQLSKVRPDLFIKSISSPFLSFFLFSLSFILDFPFPSSQEIFGFSASAQSMLWLVLFSIPVVRGQCSQQCGPISSLLSSCSLPDLDTDWHEFQHLRIERNLSGREYAPFGNGPSTARIATYDEARCFCTKAINSLSDCEACARSASESETPIANQNDVAGYYHEDCKAFGYFANSTLSSPSTTLSSMPPATKAPDYNRDCEICGVIHGQITECGLVDLDISPTPTQTSVLAEGYDFHGNVLFNRTAAECFCTLPVLRRLDGCRQCITVKNDDLREVFDLYRSECEELGYWTDNQVVEYECSPSSTTSTLSGSSPTSQALESPQTGEGANIKRIRLLPSLDFLSLKPRDFPLFAHGETNFLYRKYFGVAYAEIPDCKPQVLQIMGQYDPDDIFGEIDFTLPPIIFGRKVP